MIHHLSTGVSGSGVDQLMEAHGGDAPRRIRPMRYGDHAALAAIEAGTVLFTDLEMLAPPQLEAVAGVWKAIEGSGRPVRLLNHPLWAMRRYELLRQLHERGINEFDAFRLTEARLPHRYPVFLRALAGRTGQETELVRTPAELERAIEGLAAAASSRDDRAIVEYRGREDAQGRHRVFAAYYLDGRVIPRHLLFSRRWRVKTTTEPVDDGMLAEERAYLEGNDHAALLRSVCRLARIDFGRVDFDVVDGRVQIYGIHTNPSLFDASDARQAAHFPLRLTAAHRLIEAFDDLSAGHGAAPADRQRHPAEAVAP